MRMHAGSGVEQARMRTRQRQRRARAFAAGAGDHHLHDAGRARALQHRLEVVAEAFVAQVGADINELEGSGFHGGEW